MYSHGYEIRVHVIRPHPPHRAGEETVPVSDALPGVEALYLPLTVREARGRVLKRLQVLDAFAANLAPLVHGGAKASAVKTRIHE